MTPADCDPNLDRILYRCRLIIAMLAGVMVVAAAWLWRVVKR